MEMKTRTLVYFLMVAIISSWTVSAGDDSSSEEDEEFVVKNSNSTDVNRYVGELANKLKLDLQDNPSLKLNETASKGIPDKVYVALVVLRSPSSSDQIVKVLDIKDSNANKDSNNSKDSDSSEESLESFGVP